MDKKLLTILCCPVTHKGLNVAKRDVVDRINTAIAAGNLKNRDGDTLSQPLSEALITDDKKLLYPVQNGIPVLLEGASVNMEQLH